MNPFINPKKRGVQLAKGCKDLIDVLKDRNQGKCEYCGAAAVATVGWPGDYRWCLACQRDLVEFAAKQDFKFDFNTNDEVAVSRFREQTQRSQDDFMRQRVKDRKPE